MLAGDVERGWLRWKSMIELINLFGLVVIAVIPLESGLNVSVEMAFVLQYNIVTTFKNQASSTARFTSYNRCDK